mmetsp:Transcript_80309/g.126667  ORF Transcript_80309/g.126667 Transcript_80309/m.126667 type:complete len:231 (+) Transcript_80309:375-1067(+)
MTLNLFETTLAPGHSLPLTSNVQSNAELCAWHARVACSFLRGLLLSHSPFACAICQLVGRVRRSAIDEPCVVSGGIAEIIWTKDHGTLRRSVSSRMQQLRNIAIQRDEELFPPLFIECHSKSINTVALLFHSFVVRPIIPRARDEIAQPWTTLEFQHTTTRRPINELRAKVLGYLRRRVNSFVDFAKRYEVDIRPAEAASEDRLVARAHPVAQSLIRHSNSRILKVYVRI